MFGMGTSKWTCKRNSGPSFMERHNMQSEAESISTRNVTPPWVAKELNRPKKVQFSSFNTIHALNEKSIAPPLVATEEPKSQEVEVENPKTSEYRYFKKMKPYNDQNPLWLQKLKPKNELKRLEVHKHYPELGNNYVTDSHFNTMNGMHHGTCTSPILEPQSLEVEVKKVKGIRNGCGTLFQRKRQKLQELAAKALGVEREKLILYGSKSIAMLLQRFNSPNNKSIGRASQKKDLKTPKSMPARIRKRALQSNFQLETFGAPQDSVYGFQKAAAPFDMLCDVEGHGEVYCRKKLLKKRNSNFRQEGDCSLFSPLKLDEVHQHRSNAYQSSLHGMRMLCDSKAVDFGTDSAFDSWKLAQEIDAGFETLHDSRFLHFPCSLLPKSASFDNEHTRLSEEFPFFPDIPQSNMCHVSKSLPLRREGLGLRQWDKINHKPGNAYFTKQIRMQLLDNEDIVKHHGQEFIPETNVILEGSPSKNMILQLLLDFEHMNKHHVQGSIPETAVTLWGSPNKRMTCNPKCDSTEDFPLGDIFQNFDPTVAPWDNHHMAPWDNGHEIAVPNLGYYLSSIQLQDLTDNWEPSKSVPHFLFKETDLSHWQHKMIDNVEVAPCMTSNDQCCFAQEAGWERESLLYNFPYISRGRANFPVKCWELKNSSDVSDHDLARGSEWESLALSIYPGILDSISESSGEYLGLIPCSSLSCGSVCQSNGKGVTEFGGLNGTDCLDTANHLSFF